MKQSVLTLTATLTVLFISQFTSNIYAQELLEVDGKLKVTDLTLDNNGSTFVIHNGDGTLGRRTYASLPFGVLTLPYFNDGASSDALFHIQNDDTSSGYGLVGSKGAGAVSIPSNRAGVLGYATNAHGVLGYSDSPVFSGVYGVSTTSTGYGVSGYAFGGGIGGYFYTTSTGQAALVTGVGDVGIGTFNPDAKMHILGNTIMEHNSTGTETTLGLKEVGSDFARLSFGNTVNPGAEWHIAGISENGSSGSLNSRLNFFFKNDQGSANRMTIVGNGRVGIGTTAPDRRFEVETINENSMQSEVNYNGSQTSVGSGIAIDASAMYMGINVDLTQSNLNGTRYGVYCENIVSGTSGSTSGSHYASRFYASGARAGSNYSVYGREAATDADIGNWGVYCSGAGFISSMWTISDSRVKQDITDLTSAIEKLKLLKPKSYTYNQENYQNMNLPDGDQMGFLAQDLEVIFPSLIRNAESPEVTTDEASNLDLNPSPAVQFKAVNQQPLIALLTKAVQEQQELIDAQQNELQKQNELIQQLIHRVDEIEKR